MTEQDRIRLVPVNGSDSDEQQELVASAGARRRRRVTVGAATAVAAASAVVLWRSFAACKTGAAPAPVSEAIVGLAETYPQDLIQLADERDDLDVRKEWLLSTTQVHDALASDSAKLMSPEVKSALETALRSDDPEQARKLVDKAMTDAVERSKAKRQGLKQFIQSKRRGLKGSSKSPMKQKAIATCVFDALSLTTTVAGIAANLNDASKTCWGVDPKDLVRMGLHGKEWVHTNVCSVNVWAILGGIVGLSSTLSSAASDCAETLIPNVQALCAAAVSGLVTAVAAMGGASTLIKAACHPKGWYHDIDPHALPSNVGNNENWINHGGHAKKEKYDKEMAARDAMNPLHVLGLGNRRLEEGPAPARQLLFGGGKGSTATQCAVEIGGSMWALASAAMSINSAGNREEGGNCPPKNFLTGSKRPSSSILYRVPQAMCTIDVTSAILGFLAAITYIQLASVNCIDTLSLGAICGSGITGMMGAASGVAKAGSAIYVACDIAQKKPLKRTINFARNVDKATGGMVSSLLGGAGIDGEEEVPFGRRLNDDEALMVSLAEENIKELQKRFATPHEAFKSIGVDLEDTTGPWVNATIPGMDARDFESLSALFEKPEQVSSLFGERMCDAE